VSLDQPIVMVIAGGEWQVPLIRRAKELGLFVVNTNLYADSPGFRWADVSRIADVRDISSNLRIAREFRPDAIVTDQSDIAVPTVAALCEELGLPGIGCDAALRFTSKAKMREACQQLGVPSPQWRVSDELHELAEFVCDTGFPIVIKPVDSQSSRGVRCIHGVAELAEAFTEAKQYSTAGQVLAEQFIGGTELTVEGISCESHHRSLAVSVKRHFSHNPMVADRLLYPRQQSEFDFELLMSQHDRLVEFMGLKFGITHAEYKCWNGRFYLVEVAARGGGTRISSHIVPLVAGVDPVGMLLRMSLGERLELPGKVVPRCAAVLQFVEFSAGVVSDIRGLESARNVPGVIELHPNFKIGETLRSSADDRTRHMHLIATGTDTGSALATAAEAIRRVEVRYAAVATV
jgi:carbamoyl-phosphate synthase large subunit